jgi:hypothetical protein
MCSVWDKKKELLRAHLGEFAMKLSARRSGSYTLGDSADANTKR